MITTLLLAIALIQDPRADLAYSNHHIAYPPIGVVSNQVLGPVQVQNATFSTQLITSFGQTRLEVVTEPTSNPTYDILEFNALFDVTIDPSLPFLMQEFSDSLYTCKFTGNGQSNVLRLQYFGTLDPQVPMYSNFQVDWQNDGIIDFTPQRTGNLEVTEISIPNGVTVVAVYYTTFRTVTPANPSQFSFENLKFSVIPDSKPINTGPRLYNDAELVWHRFDFYTTMFEPLLWTQNPVIMVVGTTLNPTSLQPGVILQPNADVMIATNLVTGRFSVSSQLIGMLPDLWIQGIAVTPNGYEVGNLIRVQ